MRPCRLQKDWQSLLRSLTPAVWLEEIKERGLTTTPLSLHFTARQKPIPPSLRSERKKRGQRSPPPQPPLTDNEENTAGRRERRGWRRGGEEEEDKKQGRNREVSADKRGVFLPSDGELKKGEMGLGKKREERDDGRRNGEMEVGWWLWGVEG